MSETRNLAAILADVVGYSRLAGSNERFDRLIAADDLGHGLTS
ncbi:hypothetical protein [Mesorhizobium hawassense]|nr:hypothetical protein [Mesorhizobium hawassense]